MTCSGASIVRIRPRPDIMRALRLQHARDPRRSLRPVRSRLPAWCRRHGRSLPCARHQPRPGRGREGPPRRSSQRSRGAFPPRARGARGVHYGAAARGVAAQTDRPRRADARAGVLRVRDRHGGAARRCPGRVAAGLRRGRHHEPPHARPAARVRVAVAGERREHGPGPRLAGPRVADDDLALPRHHGVGLQTARAQFERHTAQRA
jgi:hypothetical protein